METAILTFERDPLLTGYINLIWSYLPGLKTTEGLDLIIQYALGLFSTCENEITARSKGQLEAKLVVTINKKHDAWGAVKRSHFTSEAFEKARKEMLENRQPGSQMNPRERFPTPVPGLESFTLTLSSSSPTPIWNLRESLKIDLREMIYRSVMFFAFFVEQKLAGETLGLRNYQGEIAALGDDLWEELDQFRIPPPVTSRAQ